jgi:hypothetical protein
MLYAENNEVPETVRPPVRAVNLKGARASAVRKTQQRSLEQATPTVTPDT